MSNDAERERHEAEAPVKPADTPRKAGWPKGRPRPEQRHGIKTLKRAMRELGDRALDRRSALSRQLEAWHAGIVADMGGPENVSRQQAAILDMAVKTKLLLDSIDGYLFTLPSIVNKRKRAVLPVVRERIQLADALARYLTMLGLERRAKPVSGMQGFLQDRAARKVAP